MKLPQSRTGMGTTGALGIALVILVSTGFINIWWLALAVPLVISGVGQESGK